MGKFFDEIPDFLSAWITQQHIFWVATAPLSPTGHVNVSPKGVEDTFHVVDSHRVWYEDLTGSGVETIAHLRENGRITVMFTAFEGPPRISRLFGTGTVHEFGTPEYDAYIPPGTRKPGSRAVIVVDVYKAQTSCGYAVPFYKFTSHRTQLLHFFERKELVDNGGEPPSSATSSDDGNGNGNDNASDSGVSLFSTDTPRPADGQRKYWEEQNKESLDGLPGIREALYSRKKFRSAGVRVDDVKDQGVSDGNGKEWRGWGSSLVVDGRFGAGVGVGVAVGVVVAVVWQRVLGQR